MTDLFASNAKKHAPLAQRLRPLALAEVVGQDHLLEKDAALSQWLASGHLPSLIFWGPPGSGKTTMSHLLAEQIGAELEVVSAIAAGVADLKAVFARARDRAAGGTQTVLFVDEIHRFNRSQQDALLGVVEDGTVTLIGATTENPSFALNPALLSRCQVLVLNRLDADALARVMARAEQEAQATLPLTDKARALLLELADGDARYMLNMVENLLALKADAPLDEKQLLEKIQRRAAVYDKAQESHYNLISALHKSLRGSDVQAALYWLARMLQGGEDARYIMRRLIRFAVEDIGLADPQALTQANAALRAYEMLGSPEGELAVAQCVIYLATAPKSNAAYTAYKASMISAKQHGSLMPPKHILNAPTSMMKEMGYGAGYAYDHDAPDGFSGQNFFPDDMPREEYYQPVERGFEREVQKRLHYFDQLRAKRNKGEAA